MKLVTILNQVVPGLGYELVDFEFTPTKIIRVFIDKQGGVTIDDCEIVSDQLNKLFFVEEIHYNRLEVSSPGVERPLKKIDDFKRFIGTLAKVKTHSAINNQKVFQGIIQAVNGDIIILELENKLTQEFAFANISRSRLIFEDKKDLRNKNNYTHKEGKRK